MSHKLSKNYIKSTCREIDRKRQRSKKLFEEAGQISNAADALMKMLTDSGVTHQEIRDNTESFIENVEDAA